MTVAYSLLIFIHIHIMNTRYVSNENITQQLVVYKNTKLNGEGHSRSLSCAKSPKKDFKRCKHTVYIYMYMNNELINLLLMACTKTISMKRNVLVGYFISES